VVSVVICAAGLANSFSIAFEINVYLAFFGHLVIWAPARKVANSFLVWPKFSGPGKKRNVGGTLANFKQKTPLPLEPQW